MPLFGPPNVAKLTAKSNIEGLIKALRYQKDTTVPGAAADALGQIGDARAVDPLIAALKSGGWGMRTAAAGALGQIGAPAVEPLVAALTDRAGDVRTAAARALAQIGDARAVEPLVAALTDRDGDVRTAAAGALGQIGDAGAVEPLVAD